MDSPSPAEPPLDENDSHASSVDGSRAPRSNPLPPFDWLEDDQVLLGLASAGDPRGPVLREEHLRSSPPRRRFVPALLFLATCASTFWVGVTNWHSGVYVENISYRRYLMHNWEQGLTYMACVLAILLTHEMGHFIATVRYRIPASLPFFIPFPLTPIGTMGAVIGMEGHRANRRQIFDIGVAGPIAGLLIAIPILWIGIARLDMSRDFGNEVYDCPLLIEWMAGWLRPELGRLREIRSGQLNPYFMAGWVGLLVTGLNMWPVSQLDGGHVVYALFGRRAHILARGFVLAAMAFAVFGDALWWSPMLILVTLIGIDHPRTADDRVELGRNRTILGYLSLAIPILCFPPYGLQSTSF